MNGLNREFKKLLAVYVIGFAAALLLSVVSYLMVMDGWFASDWMTMTALLVLAVIQLVIQLVCFLHLRPDRDAFSRTGTFIFAVGTVLIIVVGSIWIMKNLDYRMHMTPESMLKYMLEQNKKGF